MPLTGLTMARIKEHISHYSPIYIAGIIITILLADILYTSTAPQVPDEREVLIYLVDMMPQSSQILPLVEQAEAELPLVDDTIEDIVISDLMMTINYTEDGGQIDYNSSMLLMTRMAAGDADVYLATDIAAEQLALSGVCLPLDEYVADGWMQDLGIEPWYFTDEELGETYVAGLSLANVPQMRDYGILFDNEAKLVIAINSTNPESSMRAIEYIIRALMEGTYVPAATQQPFA